MKTLFIVWLRTCQLAGLILIEFDQKKDRFYNWGLSSIHCVIFGFASSLAYLYIMVNFTMVLTSTLSFYSFTIFVSLSIELLFFCNMVLSYEQQFIYRHKIRVALNNFLFFYRRTTEGIQKTEAEQRMMNCRAHFFTSIAIKFLVFCSHFASYFLLFNKDTFNIWFCFLSIPHVVSLAICNQFFLGVLIINYFLLSVNHRIRRIISEVIDNDRQAISKLEKNLDKMSLTHANVFNLLTDLSRFFGLQMMFNIFNSFLSIAITVFQIFSTYFQTHLSNDSVQWKLDNLIILGLTILIFNIADMTFHTRISVKCGNEVRY